jgi:outer membrane protein OmpA-like peptidoglycan-associated protein
VISVSQWKAIAAQAERVFGAGRSVALEGQVGVMPGGTGILPYIRPPLAEEGKGGQYKVDIFSYGTRITVGDILFPSGSAELSQKSKEIIDKIYKGFLANSSDYIVIKGHTDNKPISSVVYPSNWELSSGRAGAVARYLISKYNVSPTKITSSGYADTVPFASNDTEEGRQKNRRIEIWLLKGEASRVMTEMQNAKQPTNQIPAPPEGPPANTAPAAPDNSGGDTGGGNDAVPGGGF